MLDFFKPIVPVEEMHQNFRYMIYPGAAEAECEEFLRWADGFLDRDNKVVKEFQTTFNSTFWEVYVYACHKALGLEVDFSYSAPDFVSESMHGRLVAEATIAGQAEGYRPEWEADPSIESMKSIKIDKLLYNATIRLANAFSSKHRKYQKSYSALEHVKEAPFVLWIAPFEQPFHYLQGAQAIQRVLFGYDKPIVIRSDGEEPLVVGEANLEIVDKDSGASIDLGFFCDDRAKEVSAVVFSSTATFGKLRALSKDVGLPLVFLASRFNEHGTEATEIRATKADYSENLLDGLHVFCNPYAERPLPLDPFQRGEIAIYTVDNESGEIDCSMSHGHLLRRMVGSFHLDEKGVKELSSWKDSETDFKDSPTPPVWPAGVMRHVGGHSFTFGNNRMSHYKGRTILVSQDGVDLDWSAMSIPGQFHALGDFVEANQGMDHGLIVNNDWSSTAQEALEQAMQLIDQDQGE